MTAAPAPAPPAAAARGASTAVATNSATASTSSNNAPTKATSSASAKTTTKKNSSKSSAKTVVKATGAGTKTKKPVVRKKKTTNRSSSSGGSAQVSAQAREAQLDLAAQRNAAAARRSDPLWYRLEDYVLPAVSDETVMSEGSTARILPEQVQIVEGALAKNGLTRSDVTPQAFACLLEQARRFAIDILTDSQDYAFVANRTEIGKEDLALANEFRPDKSVTVCAQLPKLNLLAQTINRVPLPPIPTQCYSGILLPSKRYQLTARTFDVVTSAQTAQRMVQAVPALPPQIKANNSIKNLNSKKGTSKKSATKKVKPSYGANKGRQQIPINFKGNATSSKGKEEVERDGTK